MKILVLIRKENTEYSNKCYISSIERFGSTVVTCSYDDSYDSLISKLNSVDGVLLTGGDDVTLMGLFIIDYCVRNNLRLLGICLGMQEMGVYSSNNVLDEIGNLSHQVHDETYVHGVILDNTSKLANILGESEFMVNSHHKQKIKNSNYFKVVGHSDSGVIEAIEGDADFQIGVQWHPERMLDYDELSVKLFKEFLKSK